MDDRSAAKRQELLAQEAAKYFAQHVEGRSAADAKLLDWLRESPANVREFLMAIGTDEALKGIDPGRRIDVDELLSRSANVITVGTAQRGAHSRSPSSRRRVIGWVLGAAVVMLAVALPFTHSSWWRSGVYATTIGEQRTVALSDGSVIGLNTQSEVRVELSEAERIIHLDEGQAVFTVAHDARRPFTVIAGRSRITAIGTKFDVRRFADRTHLAVIEGQVQVTRTAEEAPDGADSARREPVLAELRAGEALIITSSGKLPSPAAIDLAQVGAWQQRRLVFRDDTLADIAAEFARYTRTPRITVAGAELRVRRYSGVFDADRPDMLVRYLQADPTLTIERRGDEILLRAVGADATR
jgi:transmembrane sensor